VIVPGEDTDKPPHDYQWAAYNFARDRKKCALFMEMGLGKTRPASAVIVDALRSFECDSVIVFGPKAVVEDTWPEELQKWAYTRDLRFVVLNGTENEIHRKLDLEGIDVYLCSYDRAHLIIKKARYPKFDMAVLDESQGVRNQATRRWQAVELLIARCDRVIELTGTPSPNGLYQLWAQLFLLDGGRRLGKTLGAFYRRWFHKNPFTDKIEPNTGAPAQIHARLRDICFTLLAEDYQKLPPLIVKDIRIKFSDALKKKYYTFEEKSVLSIPGLAKEITAVNASALYAKLTQFADGTIYDAEKKPHAVHSLKLEALDAIIDGALGENVLVIYQHRSDLQRILERYPDRAVHLKSGSDSVAQWKKGEIEIGVGHPESIGRGLNLQSGGRIVVWYGIPVNLEHYLQTIKRIWRQGQTRPVMMYRLIAEGTVDESIARALGRKNRSQADLMQALKRKIEIVLTRIK
jgi:Superfamily II DNA/RNA helicases, SNF2 family